MPRGNSAVIRRPPQGELLPKAHDMSREWALISALGPTDVPVPAALGFCESPDVTGAWFYVMGLIDGHPLYNADDTNAYVPQPQRRKMAFSFIDVLAALHSVDPDAVGLGELGKKEDYVGRQLEDLVSILDGFHRACGFRRPTRPRAAAVLPRERAGAGSGPGGAR